MDALLLEHTYAFHGRDRQGGFFPGVPREYPFGNRCGQSQ